MSDDAPSFAADIRPMFTDLDVAHMQAAGIDLASRDDCEKYALAIYHRKRRACRHREPGKPWSAEMCERFKKWWDQGCKP